MWVAAGSKANELSNMPDFNREELAINAERCLRMAHRLSRLIQQHARVLEPRKFCERSCAPRILLLSLQLESLAATLPSCSGLFHRSSWGWSQRSLQSTRSAENRTWHLTCISLVGTLTEGCACGKLAWLWVAAGSKPDELSNMPDFDREELAINAERCLRMANRLWRPILPHARVPEPRKFYERSCAPQIPLLFST